MPKSRRKPPRVVSLPRLVVPVGLSLILALSAVGFVYYTKITLYQQAHFAPDSAHPWDGYAALCLFLAMAAAALLLLNKRDPPPMRWRRGRFPPNFGSGEDRQNGGERVQYAYHDTRDSHSFPRRPALHPPGGPRAGPADAVPA